MINPENVRPEMVAFLQTLHTRLLLKMLRSASHWEGSTSCVDYEIWSRSYTVDEIKTVLATREHVPNKIESFTARKEKHRLLRHKERRIRRWASRR